MSHQAVPIDSDELAVLRQELIDIRESVALAADNAAADAKTIKGLREEVKYWKHMYEHQRIAHLNEVNKELIAALLAYMDDHNMAHDAATGDEPNTRSCPCDYCKQAHAAIAKGISNKDTARMNAGFGAALKLTRKAAP